jgi:hypothetical protein
LTDEPISFDAERKKRGKTTKSSLHAVPPPPKTIGSLEADFNEKFQRILTTLEQLAIDVHVNRDAIQELIKRLRKAKINL